MPRRSKQSDKREPEIEGAIISGLLSHWVHQDQLFWGRINLLFAVQGSIVGAWFFLRDRISSGVVIGLGALISLTLLRLAALDEKDRNRIKDLITILLKKTNIDRLFIKNFAFNIPHDHPPGARATASIFRGLLSGGGLLRLSMLLIFLFDLILFSISLFFPDQHDVIKFRQ